MTDALQEELLVPVQSSDVLALQQELKQLLIADAEHKRIIEAQAAELQLLKRRLFGFGGEQQRLIEAQEGEIASLTGRLHEAAGQLLQAGLIDSAKWHVLVSGPNTAELEQQRLNEELQSFFSSKPEAVTWNSNNASAVPWPLRSARRSKAYEAQKPESKLTPLRKVADQQSDSLHIIVRFMPPVLSIKEGQVYKVSLAMSSSATVLELKQQLLQAGVLASTRSGGPLNISEDHCLSDSQVLFHGKELQSNEILLERGLQTGSELRIIRPRGLFSKFRTSNDAPRGLLMNAKPWQPGSCSQSVIHGKVEMNS